MKVGSLGKSSSSSARVVANCRWLSSWQTEWSRRRSAEFHQSCREQATRLYYPHLTQFFPVTTFVAKTALLHMLWLSIWRVGPKLLPEVLNHSGCSQQTLFSKVAECLGKHSGKLLCFLIDKQFSLCVTYTDQWVYCQTVLGQFWCGLETTKTFSKMIRCCSSSIIAILLEKKISKWPL